VADKCHDTITTDLLSRLIRGPPMALTTSPLQVLCSAAHDEAKGGVPGLIYQNRRIFTRFLYV